MPGAPDRQQGGNDHDGESDEKREEQYIEVEMDVVESWCVCRGKVDEEAQGGNSENERKDRADKRKDRCFYQGIGRKLCAGGTERGADRHGAKLAGGADKLQVRDVGANDEQHHRNRRHQQIQRRTNAADKLHLQRHAFDALVVILGVLAT